MHPALTISEIVGLIFSEVESSSGHRHGTKRDLLSLAALARTCISFRDPALDLMWEYQRTIWNLLSCFPQDLISDGDDSESSNESIEGPLLHRLATERDWIRPRIYANRVKYFYPGRCDEWFAFASTQIFEFCNSRRPLFPRLEFIRLDLPYSNPRSIELLLSNRVTQIYLTSRDKSILSEIVPMLTEKGPLLTEAGIDATNYTGDPDWPHVVSSFVRSLQFIKVLVVPTLDQEAFEHLGRIETLTTLQLDNADIPVLSLPPGDYLFPSVHLLHFESTTFANVMAFINTTRNCTLEKLEIKYELSLEEPTAQAAEPLYSTLATRCCHASLQELSIPVTLDDHPDPAIFSWATDGLRHVFCFKNMVRVWVPQPFGFEDSDIFDLAASWPRLELLGLSGGYLFRPRVTICALYAFAQHCPNLTFLRIVVDATVTPALNLDERAFQTELTVIDITNSPMTAAPPIAAFIVIR
ncbi:hypothetical protein B0H19DRAFT_1364940 [Mycena capillaripes]|nr:hypothetical protein B0H19DRAFT_1364940 [Mycena capillaripes]